jgi:hypothetical protein
LYKDWDREKGCISDMFSEVLCSLCVPSPNDSMHNSPISLHIMHTMRRRAGETSSSEIRLISIGYGFDCLGGNQNGVQGVGSSNLLIPTSYIKGLAQYELNPFFIVRPAGRTYLEVQVLYTPGRGKC